MFVFAWVDVCAWCGSGELVVQQQEETQRTKLQVEAFVKAKRAADESAQLEALGSLHAEDAAAGASADGPAGPACYCTML